jgi:hypothetical protein
LRSGLGVEDRLDEVFQIVWLLEDPDLLAQAGGAGALTLERRGGDADRFHLQTLELWLNRLH